jgi:hypothetical protein
MKDDSARIRWSISLDGTKGRTGTRKAVLYRLVRLTTWKHLYVKVSYSKALKEEIYNDGDYTDHDRAEQAVTEWTTADEMRATRVYWGIDS